MTRFFTLLLFSLIFQPLMALAAPFSVPQTQVEVVVAPGFDHVPIKIPLVLPTGAAAADLQVTSDLA